MIGSVGHESHACEHRLDRKEGGACDECFSTIVGRYNALHIRMSHIARGFRIRARDALQGGGHGCEETATLLRECAMEIERMLG